METNHIVYRRLKPGVLYSIMIILIAIFVTLLTIKIYTKRTLINLDLVSITYENKMNSNGEYHIMVSFQDEKPTFCSIDDMNYKEIELCNFDLKPGKYTLYLKQENQKYKKDFEVLQSIVGEFSSTLDRVPIYYLALGGTKKMHYEFKYDDEFNKDITYYIEDPTILSIENDTLHGLKVGTTSFTAQLIDGNKKTYIVQVTNLIQPFSPNNDKPYLPCERYSEAEAELMDKILESRIQEASDGTRGAVLAAARFLSMELPYSIRYFNENGRLQGHGRPKIDGEGRYYHKGLYLSKSKYKDIVKHTATGPKMWGCQIYDQFISKMNMNGFTCSGFVTWAMLNGGFDIGDVGAGDYKEFNDDLSDMGPHHQITTEYMTNGNFKPGDFIGRNGHAALIIGVDDNNVYTAESLPAKLKVYTYERYHGIVKDNNLTYVIEMSDIYPNGDGFWTWMWND